MSSHEYSFGSPLPPPSPPKKHWVWWEEEEEEEVHDRGREQHGEGWWCVGSTLANHVSSHRSLHGQEETTTGPWKHIHTPQQHASTQTLSRLSSLRLHPIRRNGPRTPLLPCEPGGYQGTGAVDDGLQDFTQERSVGDGALPAGPEQGPIGARQAHRQKTKRNPEEAGFNAH